MPRKMDSRSNILQLCRLCLVKEQVNIDIFNEHGEDRQIFQKISSCLPVKVSQNDKLPKRICDGCSYKLDMCYEFCNLTVKAEQQLLKWLEDLPATEKSNDVQNNVAPNNAKPTEAIVKEEQIDPSDVHKEEDDKDYVFAEKVEENNAGPSATVTQEDEPPPKRQRRTAAVKAAIAMDHDSDDDDDSGEPLTKMEDESDDSDGEDNDPSFADIPSTSADDQPGPSGVGKEAADAPVIADDYSAVFQCETDYQEYKCPDCPKTFPTRSDLRKHSKSHAKRLLCDQCDKVFTHKKNLERHRNVKHFRNSRFKCALCEQLCPNKSALTLHTDTVHLKKYKFPCQMCFKGFNSNSDLQRHLKIDHEGERFSCTQCEKVFKDKHYFKRHRKTHDPNYSKPEFECLVCKKTLSAKSLDRHMKMHAGIQDTSVMCDICGLVVSNRSHLNNHRRTHTGEKPYSCEFCDKTFARKETLTDHRRVHTKERPYVCEYCFKGFTQKSSLNVHVRIHTGERPHSCEHCDRGFNTKHAFKTHRCCGPTIDYSDMKITRISSSVE